MRCARANAQVCGAANLPYEHLPSFLGGGYDWEAEWIPEHLRTAGRQGARERASRMRLKQAEAPAALPPSAVADVTGSALETRAPAGSSSSEAGTSADGAAPAVSTESCTLAAPAESGLPQAKAVEGARGVRWRGFGGPLRSFALLVSSPSRPPLARFPTFSALRHSVPCNAMAAAWRTAGLSVPRCISDLLRSSLPPLHAQALLLLIVCLGGAVLRNGVDQSEGSAACISGKGRSESPRGSPQAPSHGVSIISRRKNVRLT